MVTATSTNLLIGLRDQRNEHVWNEFFTRYQPVLLSFAKRLGLTEHDAQDAAQETLVAFVDAYRQGQYDRDKGRLRSWLLGIAKNRIHKIQRQRGRELVIVDQDDKTGLMNRIADDHSISEVWEAEWQRAIVNACLDEVRKQVEPTTMQAFELITLNEKSTEEVASELNMTRNAVLKAKRRVLSRMRQMQKDLEVNW